MDIIENYDADLEVYNQKAEVLRELGRFEEAIQAYKDSSDKFPHSHVPVCGMAASCSDAGMYKLALSTYDKAISQFADTPVPYIGKGHLLARLGYLSDAIPLLQKGIELSDDKTIGITALASALRMYGKKSVATKLLEKEVQEYPKSEDAWVNLIEITTQSGLYSKALKLLASAIYHLGRTPSMILQESKILSAKGDNQTALDLLNLELNPSLKYPEVYVERSRLLRKLDRWEEAQEGLKPLLQGHTLNSHILAEATILGLQDIPDDVVSKRAGARDYASIEDWNYDHACSVVLVGRRDGESAWRITLDGKKRSPFKELRRKFGLILAIARDLLGRLGSVANALKGYRGPEAVLIRAISYWKLGLEKHLAKDIEIIRRNQKSSEHPDSNFTAIIELVSSDYNAARDRDRVMKLQNSILFKAA